jgi:cellulose biosynthesis protein BcsQ
MLLEINFKIIEYGSSEYKKAVAMLRSVVYERIVYRRAAVERMGVVEYKPEDAKAIQEVVSLYEEIYGQIDNE